MRRVVLLFAIVFYGVLVYSQSFEVTPLSFNFNAEPGGSQTKFAIIKNHSSSSETFIFSISDFNINSKGESEYLEAGSIKQSIADWISISPTFFELEPNEEKEIAVTMQMPADEYGSKWGVVFIKTAKEQSTYSADKVVATGVMVSPRIAIDVYQTPGTNKSYNATITNLREIEAIDDSTRTFNVLVNNLSDIITKCEVVLIATNVETAEETLFKKVEFIMYPKNSRKLELSLPITLHKGTYSLAAILDYGSRTNLEGTQMIIKVE